MGVRAKERVHRGPILPHGMRGDGVRHPLPLQLAEPTRHTFWERLSDNFYSVAAC